MLVRSHDAPARARPAHAPCMIAGVSLPKVGPSHSICGISLGAGATTIPSTISSGRAHRSHQVARVNVLLLTTCPMPGHVPVLD